MRKNEYGSDFNHIEFDKRDLKIELPKNAEYFGCGRYAINYLISHYFDLGLWKNIYMPEYFCYDVIESIKNTGINVKYYSDYPLADDNEVISNLLFEKGDVLFRMNYFGTRSFRDNSEINIPVIEDHSHNLFSNWALNSNADWCVGSLRKTLPIPDGGILWSPKDCPGFAPVVLTNEHKLLSKTRFEAMLLKKKYLENDFKGDKIEFLRKFKETEISFGINQISGISDISRKIIQEIPKKIDYYKRKNYDYIISLLKLTNIEIVNINSNENPFSLVFLFKSKENRDNICNVLIRNDIYPAVLWVIENTNVNNEIINFSERMLSLHIDFRYTAKDMTRMSEIINKGIQGLDNDI
tara:strand:+ start:21423 stop:22481 length:1059 start_codon:yes stop_codon:yes gene_type:complete